MTQEVTVILPDGRKITAIIPEGTEDPRTFVVNELTRRGMLGLPPLTAEQQSSIAAVPETRIDPLSAAFAKTSGLSGTVPPTSAELGAAAGIGNQGAPLGARFKTGFAFDPTQGAAIALEQGAGQPVTTGQRPELGGALTFIDPATGQEQFFDPGGLDTGDIGDIPGAATVIVPEVLGGIGGGAIASVPGAVFGAGLGAGLGEATRLEIGRSLGVNPDLTGGQQALAAGTEGLTAAGVDALAFGAGSAVRRLARGPTPNAPTGALDDVGGAALTEGIRDRLALQTEFRDTFGVDLPLNTEQVLRDVAQTQSRELRGATEVVRGRPAGRKLRAQRREQAAAIETAADQVLGPTDISTIAGGRALQQQARKQPQAAIREQRRQFAEADKSLQRQEQISIVQTIDAGAAIRETLEGGRDALETRFDARYDQFREATGDVEVSLAPIAPTAKNALKQLDEDIFASLAPENRTIIEDAIGASDKTVSFDVLQRALSDLRAERRLIRKKLSPRRNIGQVNQLIKSLEDARSAALRGRPDIAKQIADLEADFAAARTRVDRGLVGRLLRPAEGGGFKLADDQVIPTILRNPDLARKMADVLSDPTFQFQPGARIEIQQGLMAALRDGSLDKKTKRMTAAKFAEFRTKNKTVFDAFFDPVTNKRMNTLAGALAEGERLTVRLEKITTDLNRTFGMNLQKFDPSQVIGRVFNGRARDIPENLRRARIIVARDPIAKEEWKKAVLAQLRRASTRATSQEPGKLDFTAIVGLAQNKEVVEELGRLFGPKWKGGFDVLVRALDTTRMAPTDAAAIQAMQAAGDPNAVIQALGRVSFPPLTREGRALTGALRINRESVVRGLDAILADPNLMSELKALRGNRSKRVFLRTLEAIGLGHIARELSED